MAESQIVSALVEEVAGIEAEICALEHTIEDARAKLSERKELCQALWTVLGYYEKREPAAESAAVQEVGMPATEPAAVAEPVVNGTSDPTITVVDRIAELFADDVFPFSDIDATQRLEAAGYPIRGKRPRSVVAGILARSARFVRNEQGLYSLAQR
jgi:hypothetical protein